MLFCTIRGRKRSLKIYHPSRSKSAMTASICEKSFLHQRHLWRWNCILFFYAISFCVGRKRLHLKLVNLVQNWRTFFWSLLPVWAGRNPILPVSYVAKNYRFFVYLLSVIHFQILSTSSVFQPIWLAGFCRWLVASLILFLRWIIS